MKNFGQIFIFLVVLLAVGPVNANTPQGDTMVGMEIVSFPDKIYLNEEFNCEIKFMPENDCIGTINIWGSDGVQILSNSSFPKEINFTEGFAVSFELQCTVVSEGSSRLAVEVTVVNDEGVVQFNQSQYMTIMPEWRVNKSGLEANVGVYFDEGGTVTSIPDTLTYPAFFPAYVIANNVDSVAAWELELASSPGVSLLLGNYENNGLNLANFPDCMVGLGVPVVPVDGQVLLASLNIYATSGGHIFLNPSTTGGASMPRYSSEEGEISNFLYLVGGPGEPVASIGNAVEPEIKRNSFVPFASGDDCSGQGGISETIMYGSLKKDTGEKSTYNVQVTGRMGRRLLTQEFYGMADVRIDFTFFNSSTGARWHPVYSPSGQLPGVHYSVADEQGNFGFSFSFDANLTGGWDEIHLRPYTKNSAAVMVAPDNGYRVESMGGGVFYDLLNESEGITIDVDPANTSISFNGDTDTRADYVFPLRHMALARDYYSDLFDGNPPGGFPPQIAVTIGAGTYAGVFRYYSNEEPNIGISHTSETDPYVAYHEYGHYINYDLWGSNYYLFAGNSFAEQQFKEGWAIFYSFAAKNHTVAKYGDMNSWEYYTNNIENAAFSSARYHDLAYGYNSDPAYDRPEYCAWACYLWNLYDGASNEGILEAVPGDNDDIESKSQLVFESLREMIFTSFHDDLYYFRDYFNAHVMPEEAVSADKILNFMMADFDHVPANVSMCSKQISNLEVDVVLSSKAVFQWDFEGTSSYVSANNPHGVRIYEMVGGNSQLVADLAWPISDNMYVLRRPNVAGEYIVTSYNGNAGESCLANSADLDVTNVDDSLPGITGITAISPNPFNPNVNIQFSLRNGGLTIIDVYSVAGKRVKRLVNSHFTPGEYSVPWDGTDEIGQSVASGVYLVSVKSSGKIDTRKVLLAK